MTTMIIFMNIAVTLSILSDLKNLSTITLNIILIFLVKNNLVAIYCKIWQRRFQTTAIFLKIG